MCCAHCGYSAQSSVSDRAGTDATMSADNMNSLTGHSSNVLTVDDDDDDDDEAEMDVDASDDAVQDDVAMERTSDNDDKRTSTVDSLLPEAVELSTVDSELSIDADDDWLASLLRYDDRSNDDS